MERLKVYVQLWKKPRFWFFDEDGSIVKFTRLDDVRTWAREHGFVSKLKLKCRDIGTV